MQSVTLSVESFQIEYKGMLLGAWGYCPTSYMGYAAQLWCMTGPGAFASPGVFLRHSIQVIDELLEKFPILIATVETDFERSRKWLEWLGFVHFRTPAKGLEEMHITRETFSWHS